MSFLLFNRTGDADQRTLRVIHPFFIIALFLRDAPNQISSLQEAMDRGDVAGVQHQVHTLKGASGNVGATRLEKVALQLEKAAEEEDANRMTELLAQIKAEFEALPKVLPSEEGDLA
jgi:HPt (histidine-containing phosphotransfer) domain-containing protein